MTIGVVVKNKEMLMEQPIDYIIDKYNFIACTCFDAEGKRYDSGFNVIEVEEVIG